jgi:uncharacterized protein YjdB
MVDKRSSATLSLVAVLLAIAAMSCTQLLGALATLTVNPKSVTLVFGGTPSQATVHVDAKSASGGVDSYEVYSDNTQVATVTNKLSASFVIQAAGPGTTTITVTSASNKSEYVDVTVTGGGGGGGGAISVTGVSLNAAQTTLAVGGAQQMLTATVSPADATNQNITWTSSSPSVASVSSQGIVTPLAVGTTTVTVTTVDGGKTASCLVTVAATTTAVTGVSFVESDFSLQLGSTKFLHYTILPSNATNQNVSWSSSNSSVASITSGGLVTGITAGTATIKVTTSDGGYQASVVATVTGIPVASVSVNPATTTLLVGGTQTISATVLPNDAADKSVTWSTGNAQIATVSANGLVTGVGPGTTTITATTNSQGKTAFSTVNVTNTATAVTGVSLSTSALSLAVGATQNLVATITPANATNQNVTWSSTSPAVATVNTQGAVTAVSVGTAYIIVMTQDGMKTATSTITVTANVPVTGVSLSTTTTSMLPNATLTLYANVIPASATNKNVAWSSTNSAVASVTSAGLVTAHAVGSAMIIVMTNDGSFSATCNVTVTSSTVAVTGLNLSQTTLTLGVGTSHTLGATVIPATATNQALNWSSNNTNVAVVSTSGIVTAVGSGTAAIAATTVDGGFSASCAVTVTVPVTGVSLSPLSLLLNVGGAPYTLTAFVSPSNATNQAVSWSSNAPGIATVSAAGVVTAVTAGSAVISVTTQDGNKIATATVTVSVPNNAPAIPGAPSPASNATGLDPAVMTGLAWTGGDPDTGDSAKYDVYLGTTSLGLVASNLPTTSYGFSVALNYNTSYKWQIVARDTHGATTTGPIWYFTTMPAPTGNAPPVLDSAYPSVSQIILGSAITLYCTAHDPDAGNILSYSWTVSSRPTGSTAAIVNPGNTTATFTPDKAGAYYIMITVSDNGSPSKSAATVFGIIVNPQTSGGYTYGIK